MIGTSLLLVAADSFPTSRSLLSGEADFVLMPMGLPSRWDSCAGEALVVAAGGGFSDCTGRQYKYEAGGEVKNARGMMGALSHFDVLLPLVAEVMDDFPPAESHGVRARL